MLSSTQSILAHYYFSLNYIGENKASKNIEQALFKVLQEGKMLTKDGKSFVPRVTVSEDEVDFWKEVKSPSGQK